MHVGLKCWHSESGSTQSSASAIRHCDIYYRITEGKGGKGSPCALPTHTPPNLLSPQLK